MDSLCYLMLYLRLLGPKAEEKQVFPSFRIEWHGESMRRQVATSPFACFGP